MRVPVSWLNSYVSVEGTVQELSDRLTFSGIEVEGIESIGSDFAGLKAATVRAVEAHPNADRLKICRVFDGTCEHQVVCGAPEVRTDARVAFAPVGAVLPAGGAPLRKARLRGVDSFGMLLAEDELGLSDDHSGLFELPAETEPGTPLAEILGPPDTVLDLEITPNRPDCLSLVGVAREVAALTGRPLNRPDTTYPDTGAAASAAVAVAIEDEEGCPRYTARVVRGVKIGPSPDWMQRRLQAAGIRPISNVVDVTNYVMLETGHPMHAFDAHALRGQRICVRRAHSGERLTTLDDVERALGPEHLVIADGEGPVALAGIMGGAGSEIGPDTRDVVLEAACFDRALIRRTARDLEISTESSYRFARGTDVEGVDHASRRAVALMLETAGGEAGEGVIDVYPRPPAAREVALRWSRLDRVLGREVPADEAIRVFRALELDPVASDREGCRVRIPSFRGDLAIEADLVEEVARVTGLDRIPENDPSARIIVGARDDRFVERRALRARLAALGLQEVMHYSLVAPSLLDRFGRADRPGRIALPNPLSEMQSVLRTSLIPQVVETLGRNRARQVEEAAVFEIGRVFRQESGGAAEKEHVAIGMMGPVGREPLSKRAPLAGAEMFRWVRGLLEKLFADLRLAPVFETSAHEALAAGAACAIRLGGRTIGHVGLVRRDAAEEWRLYEPVGLAEFECEALEQGASVQGRVQAPPVYPAAQRDLAFMVDKDVSHAHIEAVIREAAPPELEQVSLFDIFEGKGIAAGRKSMAYALTWRSSETTLKDEQVQRYQDAVTEALRTRLNAELRDA